MLKQLDKGKPPRWEIYLRIGGRRVHRVVRGSPTFARNTYLELLQKQGRAKSGLPLQSEHGYDASVAEYLKEITQANYNPGSIQFRARVLGQFRGHIESGKLQDISRNHVLAWREWRSTVALPLPASGAAKLPTPDTLNAERALIRAFFSWCVEHGYCERNPAASVPKIKVAPKGFKYMPWKDYLKMRKWLWENRPLHALAVELLAESGARVNEILSARAGDVDQDRKVWSGVKKGKKYITLKANPWMLAAAKVAKTPDAPLCPSETGRHLRYARIRGVMRTACKKCGLPIAKPHWLRHSRATWAVDAGAHPKAVQEMLGQAQLSTTEKYFRAAKGPEVPGPRVALMGAFATHTSKKSRKGAKSHGARKVSKSFQDKHVTRKSRSKVAL